MCLIIHLPEGEQLPEGLLESAARYNRDGFGIMAYGPHRRIDIVRHPVTCLDRLAEAVQARSGRECVIHLRKRTRGAVDVDNTHPFRISDQLFVAHNGTLAIERRERRCSDTWHMVNDYLKPLLAESSDLLHDATFQKALANWMGEGNSAVFMDAARGQTVFINAHQGTMLGRVWISNTRWLDAERFGLVRARRRSGPAERRSFAWSLSRYV